MPDRRGDGGISKGLSYCMDNELIKFRMLWRIAFEVDTYHRLTNLSSHTINHPLFTFLWLNHIPLYICTTSLSIAHTLWPSIPVWKGQASFPARQTAHDPIRTVFQPAGLPMTQLSAEPHPPGRELHVLGLTVHLLHWFHLTTSTLKNKNKKVNAYKLIFPSCIPFTHVSKFKHST